MTVGRIVMALAVVIAGAGLAMLAAGVDESEPRVAAGPAASPAPEIPRYLVWPTAAEFRAGEGVLEQAEGSPVPDLSDLVRRYLAARLGPDATGAVVGAAEFVAEGAGQVHYRSADGRVAPGAVAVRRTGARSGTWYVSGSGSGALEPFEVERDGDRVSGSLVPTVNGLARLQIRRQSGETLVDEHLDVVGQRLVPFSATGAGTVVVTVVMAAEDGAVSLVDLAV